MYNKDTINLIKQLFLNKAYLCLVAVSCSRDTS